MTRKNVTGLIMIALFIAFGVGLKIYQKSSTELAVKEQVTQLLAKLPDYEQNDEYITSLFSKAHPAAFDAAFSYGGRRTASSLDESRYLSDVLSNMAKDANNDGRTDISEEIESLSRILAVLADESQGQQ